MTPPARSPQGARLRRHRRELVASLERERTPAPAVLERERDTVPPAPLPDVELVRRGARAELLEALRAPQSARRRRRAQVAALVDEMRPQPRRRPSR